MEIWMFNYGIISIYSYYTKWFAGADGRAI
jgi:hypothetical protein